jgi:hypothetical protein
MISFFRGTRIGACLRGSENLTSPRQEIIMIELEHIPADEAANIAKIAELIIKQLERRYSDKPPFLHSVHTKGHGCVRVRFRYV